MPTLHLSPSYAVAPALGAEDYGGVRAAGFATVISLLSDAELDTMPGAREARAAAEAAGLSFVHIPAAAYEVLTDEVVSAMVRVLDQAPGPVLATCASGQRAAVVWAAAMARTIPVQDVLSLLRRAGLDLAFLRDDLDAQAHRGLWSSAASSPFIGAAA